MERPQHCPGGQGCRRSLGTTWRTLSSGRIVAIGRLSVETRVEVCLYSDRTGAPRSSTNALSPVQQVVSVLGPDTLTPVKGSRTPVQAKIEAERRRGSWDTRRRCREIWPAAVKRAVGHSGTKRALITWKVPGPRAPLAIASRKRENCYPGKAVEPAGRAAACPAIIGAPKFWELSRYRNYVSFKSQPPILRPPREDDNMSATNETLYLRY